MVFVAICLPITCILNKYFQLCYQINVHQNTKYYLKSVEIYRRAHLLSSDILFVQYQWKDLYIHCHVQN